MAKFCFDSHRDGVLYSRARQRTALFVLRGDDYFALLAAAIFIRRIGDVITSYGLRYYNGMRCRPHDTI